jgi:hypothetical protein
MENSIVAQTVKKRDLKQLRKETDLDFSFKNSGLNL